MANNPDHLNLPKHVAEVVKTFGQRHINLVAEFVKTFGKLHRTEILNDFRYGLSIKVNYRPQH